jgi:hypothetical protein
MSNKSKPAKGLTKPLGKTLVLLALTTIVSGCSTASNPVSERAVCYGLDAPIAAHVDALILDGGPMSLSTGRIVVAAYDGACDV